LAVPEKLPGKLLYFRVLCGTLTFDVYVEGGKVTHFAVLSPRELKTPAPDLGQHTDKIEIIGSPNVNLGVTPPLGSEDVRPVANGVEETFQPPSETGAPSVVIKQLHPAPFGCWILKFDEQLSIGITQIHEGEYRYAVCIHVGPGKMWIAVKDEGVNAPSFGYIFYIA